jgi:Carboxypeptidase regulatory-like domain
MKASVLNCQAGDDCRRGARLRRSKEGDVACAAAITKFPTAGGFRHFRSLAFILCLFSLCVPDEVAATGLFGNVTDPQGCIVAGASVRLLRQADSSNLATQTDTKGQFSFSKADSGEYRLTAEYPGFRPITRTIVLSSGSQTENIQFSAIASQGESVTVSADVSDVGLFAPNPAQRIMVRDETLDANPGRPGMPISIPGVPVESPAGGLKTPQYFVPGVAGDHGEPIAMFFQVGGFLFPNNLPAMRMGMVMQIQT